MTGILYGLQWGLNSYAEAEARPAEGAPVTLGVTVSRRNRRTLRPELALSAGPVTLGQPGGGTYPELYGSAWAVTLGKAGARLWQAVGGAWRARTDAEATAAIPAGARHVALAFDQAARPVLAWEVAGAVFVRQWSAGGAEYVTRGPWAGRDPLLICDAVLGAALEQSDVILWALTPERDALAYRMQRDLYAVAYPAHRYAGPVVLDQITAHPYRAQLLAEDDAGQVQAVTVGLYPVTGSGAAGLAVSGPLGGELFEVVMVREVAGAAGLAVSGPLSGELFEVVMVREGEGAAVMAVSGPGGGALFEAVMVQSGAGAAVMAVSGPGGGALFLAVVEHSQPAEAVSLGVSGPTGGALA